MKSSAWRLLAGHVVDASSKPLAKLVWFSAVSSAACFFVWSLLELRMGALPDDSGALLDWLASRQTLLAFVSESLFFAAVLLVPVAVAVYRWLSRAHPGHAIVAAGGVLLGVVAFIVSLIAQGRLVYPIFGLKVHTRELAELVVTLYYAGLHAAFLLLAGATLAVSLAIRRTHRAAALLGVVAVACELMVSYPDQIGVTLTFATRVGFVAWLVVVGRAAARELRPGDLSASR